MAAYSPPDRRGHPLWLPARRRATIAVAARYLGAAAVVATGVSHLVQYTADGYSSVPTIGTLFLLNFIGSIVIAVGLIAPFERVAERYAGAVHAVMAVGGIALGALSLAALFIAESGGLFGFVERGYRMGIVVAIVVEGAAIVFLVVFLLADGTVTRRHTE